MRVFFTRLKLNNRKKIVNIHHEKTCCMSLGLTIFKIWARQNEANRQADGRMDGHDRYTIIQPVHHKQTYNNWESISEWNPRDKNIYSMLPLGQKHQWHNLKGTCNANQLLIHIMEMFVNKHHLIFSFYSFCISTFWQI